MAALGIDIAGVEDVDLFLSSTDEKTSAGEAALRALLHSPGKLWWAPDSGHDVTQYIHSSADPDRIQANVQAACEIDERIKSADVEVTTLGKELRIKIDLTLINGDTATLTLLIDALGKVLDAQVLG